jgi:tRNA pseudouridine55 synthase
MPLIAVYKPPGFTPLEVIKKLRQKMPEFLETKIGYAGRLDPLARGVMLLMIGDSTKQKDIFQNLPKAYEFMLVFGLQTDTYDLLGIIKTINLHSIPKRTVNSFVNTFVKKYIGKQLQSYPPYSSKPVAGKPLFWWAKNGKLKEITIPYHEVEIYDFVCLETGKISFTELASQTEYAIKSVRGDFRQKEILNRWKEVFANKKNQNKSLPTVKFRITCSSGTYIREIAHQMGQELGCGAIATDILRTNIGNYTLAHSLTL